VPLKVLVVEDHDSLRDLFRICLAMEDDLRLVGLAADGESALELAAALQPDAVVLDHELPGQDGLAALPALRAAVPGVRVIMFSASADDATRALAYARGADAYLVKDDSDIEDVLAALRSSAVEQSLSA
jgi:DNA-binding NarL/FixJ family response regulator